MDEFGARRGNAVQQVTDWLGGAAEAPHNYANIVKYGVGKSALHRFTGISKSTIQEAEKCSGRAITSDFNAYFKRSRGLPSLLQESNGSNWNHSFSLEQEHYDRATLAIEPSDEGLGKDFLRHFLPPHSVANNSTLQATIAAYYQEQSAH